MFETYDDLPKVGDLTSDQLEENDEARALVDLAENLRHRLTRLIGSGSV